jgi:D-3-phosphoglycerate dehydrogenase|tara:strand:+ start:331 stop:1272 length:942 start_codon:yes stop_codon:yes gene_type:complete
MNKVLIADSVSSAVSEVFDKNGIAYDTKIGLSEDELATEITEYSGLIVRSAVTVTEKIINSASNLKVIGRPGVGVDNVDLKAATNNGIVVMNTPLGNVQATAELTFGIMHSLMRKISNANQSMHQKKWEKKKFIGNEMYGKTIGIIGFGNIGKKVSQIAHAYGMNVLVYSASISPEDEKKFNVTNQSIDDILEGADIITFHNKLSENSKYLINSNAITKMKKNAIIINCARGGLVNEKDIKEALEKGNIAGYGCDVYENEPEQDSIFSSIDNVVMTPHIGASTIEAQEKVAYQIAEQIVEFLKNNKIINQVNK